MIKMARHLVSALVAVGPVSYTETALHAGLPSPGINSVSASSVTLSVRVG